MLSDAFHRRWTRAVLLVLLAGATTGWVDLELQRLALRIGGAVVHSLATQER